MNNKPIELASNPPVNDEPELALNPDEITQLAKFLDALLEVDIANPNDGGKSND